MKNIIAASFVLSIPALVQAGDPFDPNKTLFLIGQDTGTVSDFKASVLDQSSFPTPDGTSVYTNLVYTPDTQDTAPLQGFYQAINYGSGRNDFTRQLNEYKGALAVGLYMVDTSCNPTADNASPELRNLPMRAVANDPTVDAEMLAVYADKLDEMIDYFMATDRDVLLRIGYEFDGPWNCYTPETYVEGFRAIKRRIDEKGATNIHTVWQSATYPLRVYDGRMAETHDVTSPEHFDRWYPGDEYVDVVGLSFFFGENFEQYALPESCYSKEDNLLVSPRELQNQILDFSRKHNKPVMIAESAPQGIETDALQARCTFTYNVDTASFAPTPPTEVSAEDIWDLWYEDYFQFIKDNKDIIKAVTYINTYWDEQPLWACTEGNCSSGYWGDSRIQTQPLILERFAQALREPHFKASPLGSLGFEPEIPFDGQHLEAEYAKVPLMWERGSSVNGYGTPQVSLTESNQNVFIIFNDGGAIEFEDNVKAGKQLKIRYATVTESEDPEAPYTFSVYVDGVKTAEVPFTNTGLSYVDVMVPADIKDDSVITLELNSGFVIWFDFIKIYKSPVVPTGDTPIFGFDGANTLFHVDGGHTARYAYLCINNDCRAAEKEGGRYVRTLDTALDDEDTYQIQFKVQDDSSAQCVVETSLAPGDAVNTSVCAQ